MRGVATVPSVARVAHATRARAFRAVAKGGAPKPGGAKPERLDRLLSRLGYCTRAEAKRWVGDGRVTLNGAPVKRHDAKVSPVTTGELLIDGEPPDHPDGLVAMLHKPPGFVCSHDAREGPNVYDLLPARWRARNPTVEAVGRLDKDTTGLLLLTDDGELLHRLTSPKKDVPKTYELEVDADIPDDTARVFASGELMLTNETKPCAPAKLTVSRDSLRVATLELTEGRFHQVKRMMRSRGVR